MAVETPSNPVGAPDLMGKSDVNPLCALGFSLDDWRGWRAGADSAEPDVTVIPAMLRRRLSPLGRAILSLAIPLMDQWGDMPIVFASRHGEVGRTLGLLQDMAKGELMSPTAFSLSVHNATAGLYSIHRGLTKNITAISGGSQDLVAVLLEALGQCNAAEPRVLCLICDEPLPEIYRAQEPLPEAAFALALVVSRDPGGNSGWQLLHLTETTAKTDSIPQALQLMTLLQTQGDALSLAAGGSHWLLQRGA